MNVIENNKLMAEFLGLESHLKNGATTIVYMHGQHHIQDWEYFDKGKELLITPIEMKFHNDWNWLMEVVEKIYNLSGENKPYYGITFVMHNDTFQFGLDNQQEKGLNKHISSKKNNLTRIQVVYNACIEFIKWYNNQNK